MVVQTQGPGATAAEIGEQVTDKIEKKLQEIPDLDYLRSYSRPGESQVFVVIKDSVSASRVPDVFYQVRKKIGDIRYTLPPGIAGPFFNDEFGDTFGNIFALTGEGYDDAQFRDYAERIKLELLRVPDVAKVDLIGLQDEKIFIELSNTKLATLGVSFDQVQKVLESQNAITASGSFETATDRIYMRPSGAFDSVDSIRNIAIRANGQLFRLGDVADVKRGYADPPQPRMRYEGRNALGIAVSMRDGGDILALGRDLDAAAQRLRPTLPVGLELDRVADQPHAVARSVGEFVDTLAIAVGIVLLVSFFSLGFRTGLVVALSIPLVLAMTFAAMKFFGIDLHKISLGALVLALGLLVDDAIIAVEMMAVKLEQGWNRSRAAAYAYTSTAFPMLTGTLVTVAGFLPIALAKSSTGEYTRSIFEVSAIALIASWFAAVVLIPLLGYKLLPERKREAHHAHDHEHDIYDTKFYARLRGWLTWCIERRFVVLGITLVLFVIALAGFTLVPQQFFPSSDRSELLVDVRLQEGASFEATLRETKRLEKVLEGRPEVDHLVNFVGSGAPRFYLPLDQQLQVANFAQFVITAKSVDDREKLARWLEPVLRDKFSSIRTRLSRLENGPPVGYPVQFRVSGDDLPTVRGIAEKVFAEMSADSGTANVQYDWDEPSERSVRFDIDQKKARELGISSQDVSDFLAMQLTGYTVTQYRERD
jgi:multidrug efflux pump